MNVNDRKSFGSVDQSQFHEINKAHTTRKSYPITPNANLDYNESKKSRGKAMETESIRAIRL